MDKAPIQMTRSELLVYIEKELYPEIEEANATIRDLKSECRDLRDQLRGISEQSYDRGRRDGLGDWV